MMGKGEGDCEDFRDGRNCFRAKQYGATETARACSDSETIHKKHWSTALVAMHLGSSLPGTHWSIVLVAIPPGGIHALPLLVLQLGINMHCPCPQLQVKVHGYMVLIAQHTLHRCDHD